MVLLLGILRSVALAGALLAAGGASQKLTPPAGYADNHAANTASLALPAAGAAAAPRGYPFTWKCRVVGVAAAPGPPPAVPTGPLPGLPATTRWSLGKSAVVSNGTEWSEEGNFTLADLAKAKKWESVVITHLTVATVPPCGTNGSLTSVECQITLISPPGAAAAAAQESGGRRALLAPQAMVTGSCGGSPIMCDPKAKKHELCPGGIKCPQCGKAACT